MRGGSGIMCALTALIAAGCASFDSNNPSTDASTTADGGGTGDAPGPDADLTCVAPPGWELLGQPLRALAQNTTTATMVSLEVRGNDEIVLAWPEGDATDIYTASWNGTAFDISQPVNPTAGNTPTHMPNIRFAGADLVMSFSERDVTNNISEMLLYRSVDDGVTWQADTAAPLGSGLLQNIGHTTVVGADGVVYVGWSVVVSFMPFNSVVPVVQIDAGTATAVLPTLGGAINISNRPQLGFDAAETLLFQYEILNLGVDLYERGANDWFVQDNSVLDVDPNNNQSPQEPILGFRADRTPLLLISEVTDGVRRVYAYEKDGAVWMANGPGIEPVGNIASPLAVAEDNEGRIIALYHDRTDAGVNQLYLARLNGAAWESVGVQPLTGSIADSVDAFGASLAIDDCGRPIVAFVGNTGPAHFIHVVRYNGDE